MAFSLVAYYDITESINLTNGSPFKLEKAEGLSSGGVVRHQQRSPLQHGATDLGFRLTPRIVTLNLLFHATTAAQLDGYRDDLIEAFRPSVPIVLRATRDDGEVRDLNCHAVDEVAIELLPEHKAAKLHRATVRLRAASPLLRATTTTSSTFNYSGLSEWWLAGGAIPSGSVLVHVTPSIGNTWNLGGAVTGNWAIAVVAEQMAPFGTSAHYLWDDNGSAGLFLQAGTLKYTANNITGQNWPGSASANYHVVENRTNTTWWYWTGGTVASHVSSGGDTNLAQLGAWGRRFGGSPGDDVDWSPGVQKAMIWTGQTEAQIQALAGWMLNRPMGSVTVVNDGDVYAYPVIRINGPISDPVLVNATVGGTINLTGLTLGSTDYYTIDLRDGDKRVTDQGGASQLASVTNPVGLAGFYLAPAPIAAGGTNVITLTPGSAGSAAYFSVEFTNQYMSI